MGIVKALFLSYSLSGAAGMRASWVMFVVSWSVHFGYLHPAESFLWIGSGWIMFLAAAGSIVDFVGDKIPVLDHALHAVHLILAPVVGVISGLSGYQGDEAIAIVLGLIGGGNALVLHSARSGLRAVSSATTLGMANPVISLAEDIMAFGFIVIALFTPIVTGLALVLITIWAFRKLRGVVAYKTRRAV